MKKLLLIPLFALASACSLPSAGIPGPSTVANKVVLDEKTGIAIETMYTAITRAGALAFRTGVVKPSTNPAVQRNDFCVVVLAGKFVITDLGSKVSALECRLRQARDLTRQAYDASNADSYETAAREAISVGRQILDLIGSN